MRQLAVLGIVVSLVLGGIAIFETSESVSSRRNDQDRSLQAAIAAERELVAGGVRQITSTLSVLPVDPAVAQLLGSRAGSSGGGGRSADLRATEAALGAVRRSSFLSFSAACLDDNAGREVICSGGANASSRFPTRLGAGFAALAAHARTATVSGPFLSPLSGGPSVAFLEPLRIGGRTLGLVHLDASLARAWGSSLLVAHTPGVRLQVGRLDGRHMALAGPANGPPPHGLAPIRGFPVHARGGVPSAKVVVAQGHRSLIATLPLMFGGDPHPVLVAATTTGSNPTVSNTWTPAMMSAIEIAVLLLIGSSVALLIANRRVVLELSTDPLTGLRNRRALIDELPRVCQRASEEKPAFLWFFDLNGFKNYNDSFGHVAGDALLTRLGNRLRTTVGACGSVYRLGGDEFCALIAETVEDPHGLFHEAREALSERGGAFTVCAAAGAVEIPRETRDPTQALRLADQHMYREKAISHGGTAELITAVLHAALAQRHPDLGEHSDEVADDVEVLARTIGLDEETIASIIKAGDLHDVGKLGIPDEIITKPGPLNAEEWEFMKQHTVMGEQIIAAAGPSLEHIGPLVRASHERWDGKGYPDGLAGEEIPLGARIITICDSFRAMLDVRAYKPAMGLDDALAELRRCAGTQFDPALVEVFCRLVTDRTAIERLRGTAG